MSTPPIHLHVLCGPQAGHRLTFDKSPVTFGRDGDNDLVIPEAILSRRHGELVCEDDTWSLVNHSTNPTLLGNKRVKKKPRPVRDHDIISVGGTAIMEVRYAAAVPAAAEAAPADDTPSPDDTRSMSTKAKLWIGIGAWWLIAGIVTMVLLTLDKGTPEQAAIPKPLADEQIAADVARPVERSRTDARLSSESIDRGDRYWERRSLSNNLFRAYEAYQAAEAYSEGDALPLDRENRLIEIRKTLTAEVNRRYDNAIHLLETGQLREAEEEFRDLMQYYNRPDSILHTNIKAYRLYIVDRLEQERRERRR